MIEELRKKDFNKLLLNCYSVHDGDDIFKVFPILAKYKVFKNKVKYEKGDNTIEILTNRTKLIKYIICAYDPNSPFQVVEDTLDRRAEAAQWAGYEVTNRKFDGEVDMMIRCMLPEVNRMIVQYCLMNNEDDYAVLVVYQESLRRELEALNDPNVTSKQVKDLIANIKTFEHEIRNKKDKLLAGNMDTFINKTLFEYMESKKLELSPEYIAKHLIPWDNVSIYYKNAKIGA